MLKVVARTPGFTIIEALVALFVVVTAVAAGAGLNQAIFRASQVGEDQALAAALAEDGVRLARTLQTPAATATGVYYCTITTTTPNSLARQPLTSTCGTVVRNASIPWCGTSSACTLKNQRVTAEGELIAVATAKVPATAPRIVDTISNPGALPTELTSTTGVGNWVIYRRFIDQSKVTVTNVRTGVSVTRTY